MFRYLPHPLLTVCLALLWMLLTNSIAPGSILMGLFLGWAIPLFTFRFWPDEVRIHRPGVLLKFVGLVLVDILVANLNVARLILGRPQRLRPGFVDVPLDIRSELGVSFLANTITLTPGTVSAWLAPDGRTLVVHALDVDDPDDLVETIKQRYEAPLREVFEG